jgi:hypothetical protein
MKAAYVRLALAVMAFLGWLGYLGYLVAERPGPGANVLSRPQILVSDIDVVAVVKQGSDVVRVKEVLYSGSDEARALAGKEIKVTNLADCHPPGERGNATPDLTADGEYLLPLQEPGPDGKEYRVAPTPPSPGFARGTPRIYPATHEILAQYAHIAKK